MKKTDDLTDLFRAVQRGEKIQKEALIPSQLIESDDQVLVEVSAHPREGKCVCLCIPSRSGVAGPTSSYSATETSTSKYQPGFPTACHVS